MNTEKLVNSSRVADSLGVSRAAVSNWTRRGKLPPELRPLDNGPGVVPLWPESKLPALRAWQDAKPRANGRNRVRRERMYSLSEVVRLLNEGADLVMDWDKLGPEDSEGEERTDLVNLVVNVIGTMLRADNPDTVTVEYAIEENQYGVPPEQVACWLGGAYYEAPEEPEEPDEAAQFRAYYGISEGAA